MFNLSICFAKIQCFCGKFYMKLQLFIGSLSVSWFEFPAQDAVCENPQMSVFVCSRSVSLCSSSEPCTHTPSSH